MPKSCAVCGLEIKEGAICKACMSNVANETAADLKAAIDNMLSATEHDDVMFKYHQSLLALTTFVAAVLSEQHSFPDPKQAITKLVKEGAIRLSTEILEFVPRLVSRWEQPDEEIRDEC
jgi:hypothetical protein